MHGLINTIPDTFEVIGLFCLRTHCDRISKQTTKHPHCQIKHPYKSHRSCLSVDQSSIIENVFFSVWYCFLSAAFAHVVVSSSLFLCVGVVVASEESIP